MYRSRYELFIAFLFIFVANLTAQDYLAYEPDSSIMSYTGKDVVIEFFKQNSDLSVQPVSATTLSDHILTANSVTSIKEITGIVPNLFMPDYGSKMFSPIYIRGIGSRINSPSVGLYVDGVPYFDRSTFDINIADVERIEVLRGPQGTIYGRNTMGGIVNVFTKNPLNGKATNIGLSAGNYETYRTTVSHYGNSGNKFGYALSGNYSHTGGYFDNVTTNKKADPLDAVSTRLRLTWRIQPRLTADLILAYEYSDQDGYPYRVYDKTTSTIKDIDYDAHSFFRRNMSSNGFNLEYVGDKFRLGSQSSFQYFDGRQGLDQDFTPKDLYYVDFSQRQQMYSQEFNIKSLDAGSKYVWQFGLFGFYQNYSQSNDVDYRTLAKHDIKHVNNPTGGAAVYHQSTFNDILVPHLSLALGVRYDWERTKSNLDHTVTEKDKDAVVDPTQEDKATFSQVTPKASIQYSFSADKLVYFSAAKGYKTGGFNTTAEDKSERTFDPEHSWSYELGARSGFFNNLLFLDLTLFYIDWKDQQVSQARPDKRGYLLRNAGRSSSKGIEFTAQVKPIRNLSVQLAYGFTEAKYKDYNYIDYNDADKEINFDNNSLPMVPRNTVSLSAEYRLDVNRNYLDYLVFNGQYNGVGKLYWNDANDFSQPFYGLYNGRMSFVKKMLSVSFWTKNIGNKDYIAYYFSTGKGSTTQYYVQKGKPFTCGVDLSLKF